MKEILITSSALILALLLLRQVFRKTLSRRVQYALWGLVLLRLLLPVSLLPAAGFSVLTATAPVQQAVAQQVERPHYFRPVGEVSPEELSEQNISVSQVPTAEEGSAMILMEPPAPGSDISYQQRGYLVRDAETNSVTLYEHMAVGPWEALTAVWKAGMVLMGCFFLLSNLLFYRRLRKSRREFSPEGWSGRRVYLVPEGVLPSPCLFLRSIYLTPAAIETPETLRHVLTHEETHARHWDPLWSLLRCVCLTVYWFDPLVWVAAACSKTDCELACDESVLKVLGEDARIGYGETLLSLIPVKRSNPLISATTMTAGKKQLRDRITRIAQRPRQLLAAVAAVAVLASIAAACTFTGGKAAPTPDPAPSPSPAVSQAPIDAALRSLTAEELRWFNEEYFNSSGADQTGEGGMVYNIRNQFANPGIRYDRPEDIDLYELFYCDGEILSDEEYKTVFGGDEMNCPAFKLTAEAINSILEFYTGLTLDKTEKVGLENFTYQDDAYYWMHGDTNYCGDLQFPMGTREGDTVRLYHTSDFAGSSWYCVTLADKGDGRYWFVSNQSCEAPAIAPLLPAGEPDRVIPLDSLEPQVARVVASAYADPLPASDFPGGYENRLDNWNFDGHHVMAYKTAEGQARVVLVHEDGSFGVFYDMDPEQYGGMFFFHDLFGQDGFYVDYTAEGGPRRDYYYFNENGKLTQLLEAATSVRGGAFQLDLDGDGDDELIADETLFFHRERALYRADLKELAQAADPALGHWDWSQWSVYGRYLYARGYTEDFREWTRYLYFDGENLLVYKDEKPTEDHMVDGADWNVPAAVVEEAKAYVESQLEPLNGGGWINAEDAMYKASDDRRDVVFDDWRVESFQGPYLDALGEITLETWAFNYELHTATPEKVTVAGGRYVTEDGWVSPGYPGCDWLIFQQQGENLKFLWHEVSNDTSPGSPHWAQHLEDRAARFGLVPNVGYAARQVQSDLDALMGNEQVYFNLQTADGVSHIATGDPGDGNGPNRQLWFTQPDTFKWHVATSVPSMEGVPRLILSDETWERYLCFYEGSDLVMSVKPGAGAEWYQAVNLTDPQDVFYDQSDIFHFMRMWYDELELAGYERSLIVDPSLPPEEAARIWAERYENAHLSVLPDSRFAWSYVRVEEDITADEMPDGSFACHSTTVFVPATELAHRSCWAGNTSNYTGDDPEVPQGALEHYRVVRLVKEPDGWHCTSYGTG